MSKAMKREVSFIEKTKLLDNPFITVLILEYTCCAKAALIKLT
jgi:hypothetical protein